MCKILNIHEILVEDKLVFVHEVSNPYRICFVCFCYGECLLICSIAEWKELQWNFDEEYFFWATCWTVLYFWCFGNSRIWRFIVCFLMLIQWWMTQELSMWFAMDGVFWTYQSESVLSFLFWLLKFLYLEVFRLNWCFTCYVMEFLSFS